MPPSRALIAIGVAAGVLVSGGCAQEEQPAPPGQVTPTQFTSPPPPKPEVKLTREVAQQTTLKRNTQGTISVEPYYIIAGVGINLDNETASLSLKFRDDYQPYRIDDLRDGQNFEIRGIPFHLEIYPMRGEVTVYQLAAGSAESTATPSP